MKILPTFRPAILAAVLIAPAPLIARETLQQQVEGVLADAGQGVHWGMVVETQDGRRLISIDPDGRFIPASNTKMFTTAAAFWSMPGLNAPDRAGGASVRLQKRRHGAPDVVLTGHGDARLSARPDCQQDCLATLANAVAAKTHQVHDIVGDDTLFPDERWSPGMSWNNIPTHSGTGISALTINDNEVVATVTPSRAGQPPKIAIPSYYQVDNRAVTLANGPTRLNYDRMPDGYVLRVTGTINITAAPLHWRLGVDDPARYAAWLLRRMLRERGVKVTGAVRSHHRPLMPSDDPVNRNGTPPARPPQPTPLARLTPPPLGLDLIHINKVSQNLHAELILRRLGLEQGAGSIADGLTVVKAMLTQAGVDPLDYDFSDGSGMSTYNRVAPAGAVKFLRWIAQQPWGTAWKATLPVADESGTVGGRFHGTLLAGKLWAKTGSLNATRALSGYMLTKDGRKLTFSVFANDIPPDVRAKASMDKALELIAAEN